MTGDAAEDLKFRVTIPQSFDVGWRNSGDCMNYYQFDKGSESEISQRLENNPNLATSDDDGIKKDF